MHVSVTSAPSVTGLDTVSDRAAAVGREGIGGGGAR